MTGTAAVLNARELEREIKRFSRRLDRERKHESKSAMARVLTRNAKTLKSQTVKLAAPRLDVKQKYIRPRVFVKKATANKMVSGIWVGTRKLNALSIGAVESDDGYRAGPYHWRRAFVWKGKRGNRILLQRKGKARYPLQSATLGQRFVEGELRAASEAAANRVLSRDLQADLYREMRYRMEKLTARGK